MTKAELNKVKEDLKKRLTDEARRLYSSKDKDNQLRIGGLAKAIKIIEDYDG